MKIRRSSMIIGAIGGASALIGSIGLLPHLRTSSYDKVGAKATAALIPLFHAVGAEDIFQTPVFWFAVAVFAFVSVYFGFLIMFGICRLLVTKTGAKLLAGVYALTGGGVAYAVIIRAEIYGVGIPGRFLLMATMTVIGFVMGVLMSATAREIALDAKKTKGASGASSTIEGEE